jgi:nifR3 family TIM-barrel protein
MRGFWDNLTRPAVVLAPLAGVTDAAFRRVIARWGKPPAMWTEFVSADGLCSAGRDNILHDLWYSEAERPIVGQLVGGNPESFRQAARLLVELGFDGVDINMGCPVREVEKRKAGAALIRHPQLAAEIVAAAKDGAGHLPVSVKTRIGYRENEIEPWLTALIDAQPAAITIHARTRDEMSKVPARWDVVADAAALARRLCPDAAQRPLIIGNGDVATPADALRHAALSGCDGVMIGRGIFGNPWLFSTTVRKEDLPLAEVLDVLLEHTSMYVELLGARKPIELMKKHFKAYVHGFDGAAELRAALMATMDYDELKATIARLKSEASAWARAAEPLAS